MAGHQGVRRTTDRVMQEYYWPDLRRDVRHFVRTCGTCPHNVRKRKTGPSALAGDMPTCCTQGVDVPDQETFKSKTSSHMSNDTFTKSTVRRLDCETAYNNVFTQSPPFHHTRIIVNKSEGRPHDTSSHYKNTKVGQRKNPSDTTMKRLRGRKDHFANLVQNLRI